RSTARSQQHIIAAGVLARLAPQAADDLSQRIRNGYATEARTVRQPHCEDWIRFAVDLAHYIGHQRDRTFADRQIRCREIDGVVGVVQRALAYRITTDGLAGSP